MSNIKTWWANLWRSYAEGGWGWRWRRIKKQRLGQLHSPGVGRCWDCNAWSPNQKLCTVIVIAPQIGPHVNTFRYNHSFTPAESSSEECIFAGLKVGSSTGEELVIEEFDPKAREALPGLGPVIQMKTSERRTQLKAERAAEAESGNLFNELKKNNLPAQETDE